MAGAGELLRLGTGWGVTVNCYVFWIGMGAMEAGHHC